MRKIYKTFNIDVILTLVALSLVISFTACRSDVELILSEDIEVDTPDRKSTL